MPRLTTEEVAHIAELARLSLTEEEREQFRDQMSAVLEYIGKLKEVDTVGVPPTLHAATGATLRDDVVQGCDGETRERLLKNLPRRKDDLVETPAVF
ncbi:MAG: Asp-tRNA(Asn)/Glu-tRNA(Gln) amidotransferase subunit GatC [Patescibacteria group bacterium]